MAEDTKTKVDGVNVAELIKESLDPGRQEAHKNGV